MATHFSFTKPLLESLVLPDGVERAIFHDTHKNSGGLQLRSTKTAKTFFIQKRIDGKPERFTIGQFPSWTVENARKEAQRLSSLIAQGINPNSDSRALKTETTMDELFESFLKHKRSNRGAYLTESTKKGYRSNYENHLKRWGNRKLSQLKDTDFSALHERIGKNVRRGKETTTTANRVMALAQSLFSFAIDKKLYRGNNPVDGIKKFPEDSRMRFIQTDELPNFFTALAELPSDNMRDYFLISLLTGARRSNVLAMRWADINLTRGEWFLKTTKNGESQTITLSPEAIEILKSRQSNVSPWVFPSATSKSGHLTEPKKSWQALLQSAGLENLRIHDLRRTLGSWQAKAGASLSIIGRSLNHKTANTTAIYARLDLDPVRESVNTANTNMLVAAGVKLGGDVLPLKKIK